METRFADFLKVDKDELYSMQQELIARQAQCFNEVLEKIVDIFYTPKYSEGLELVYPSFPSDIHCLVSFNGHVIGGITQKVGYDSEDFINNKLTFTVAFDQSIKSFY